MTDPAPGRRRVLTAWLVPALLAGVGFVVVLLRTGIGAGTTGDSVSYVMGARTLLAGEGYSRLSGGGELIPITGFPPGYSVALAAASVLGGDPYGAGRLLNAALFAANIFLAGVIVFRSTRSWAAGGLTSALLLLSDDMIHIHSWIMSEGLFIFLFLVSVLLLEVCLRSGAWLPAVGLGLLAAAATLTRYVGLSLGAAEGLALLLLGGTAARKRWLQAVVFALAVLLPVGAWFGRNALLAGTTINRGLGYHPLEADLITAFLGTANAWFFPLSLGLPKLVRAGLSVIVGGGIALGFIFAASRRGTVEDSSARKAVILPWLLVFFLPAYAAILLVNSMFLDASTSPSGAARYLIPVYVGLVMLLVSAGHFLFGRTRRAGTRAALAGIALVVLSLHAVQTAQFLADRPNLGYTDLQHEMSSTIAELQSIGEGRVFIANNVELVYVLTGRPAYAMPIVFDHYRQVYREDFAAQVDLNRSRLAEGALLLIYGSPDVFEETALAELGAVPVREFPRITVYADPQVRIP